jgi:Acyltransferase family
VTSAPIAAPITRSKPAGDENYSIAIGYLRAAIIVGVVAVHSVMAYCSFAPVQILFGTKSNLWQAYPIVDARRWAGFDPIVGFTDPFAMSLMFFLSGLLVWNSLKRKGIARFGRERAIRLGLPFALTVVFLAPAAYYPTCLATTGPPLKTFLRQWLSLREWPSGPAWFIWVLLTYDLLASGFYLMMPQLGDRPSRLYARVFSTPIRFFWTLTAVSGIAYIPMALIFGPGHWTIYGPFMFQTSRLAHYAVWFSVGLYAGIYGIHRGVMARDGALAQNWLRWLGWAWAAYGVLVVVTHPAMHLAMSPFGRELIVAIVWVQSCTAGILGLLALFLRFGHTRIRIMDSLCENSYGIYLVHYLFVIWLQYFLLRVALPALAKGSIVLLASLGLSWASVAALRRLPGVAHII